MSEEVTRVLEEAEGLAAALARDLERDPRSQDAGRVARIIEGLIARAALVVSARLAEAPEGRDQA